MFNGRGLEAPQAMRNNSDCIMAPRLRRSGVCGPGLQWFANRLATIALGHVWQISVGKQLSRSLRGTTIVLMYGAQAALVNVVRLEPAVLQERLSACV